MAPRKEIKPTEIVRCSYERLFPIAQSPDGVYEATLVSSQADDQDWSGPSQLTVRQVETEAIVWQQTLAVSAKRLLWTPDGAYILLDDSQADSPIWRIRADGSAAVEEVVPDGYLLDVVPASQSSTP